MAGSTRSWLLLAWGKGRGEGRWAGKKRRRGTSDKTRRRGGATGSGHQMEVPVADTYRLNTTKQLRKAVQKEMGRVANGPHASVPPPRAGQKRTASCVRAWKLPILSGSVCAPSNHRGSATPPTGRRGSSQRVRLLSPPAVAQEKQLRPERTR